MDYLFASFLISLPCFVIFIDGFLRYYVARYDLSEEQLAHILDNLPDSIKPYRAVISVDNIELFVKSASVSFAVLEIALTGLGPLITTVGLYITFTRNDLVSVLLHLLLLFGYFYLVFKFIQIIRHVQ
jgi:hypothetical protein